MKPLDAAHIVIESDYTHAGDKKELTLLPDVMKNLTSFWYFAFEDMPNNGDTWANEKAQRDIAKDHLIDGDVNDDDIILITDLDEVVNPDCIKYFLPSMGCASLRMDKFSYYLNVLEGRQTWNVGRICTWEYLKDKTLSEVRNSPAPYDIPNAGWHWSFLGGVDKIIDKLFAYAHTESLTPFTTDPENLKRKLENNQSLWTERPDDLWELLPIDERFPEYIRNNEQYLTDMGLIKKYK